MTFIIITTILVSTVCKLLAPLVYHSPYHHARVDCMLVCKLSLPYIVTIILIIIFIITAVISITFLLRSIPLGSRAWHRWLLKKPAMPNGGAANEVRWVRNPSAKWRL